MNKYKKKRKEAKIWNHNEGKIGFKRKINVNNELKEKTNKNEGTDDVR